MKQGTSFLKGTIFMIGLLVLTLSVFWLPSMASEAARLNPDYAYLQFPILIGLYMTAIPFFLALSKAWTLLNGIEKKMAFSEQSMISLTWIKRCAITILFLYVFGMLLLTFSNALHPGIFILGATIMFATIIIAFFAALFQKLLRTVMEIKSENDLTI